MEGSKRFQLNSEDGIKIARVFVWLLASTTISFLITLFPQIELGSMAWILPIVNILLVAAQKAIKDNQPKEA